MTAPTPTAATEKKGSQFLRRLALRMKRAYWNLHLRFPHVFPDRRDQAELEQERKIDAERNAQTTPEAEDGAELIGVWAVEFYTPSHYQGLLSAFRELGWDRDDAVRESPSSWLSQMRTSAYSTGRFSLGTLVRPGAQRRFLGEARECPLPDFCEYATGHLFQINSSLAAICMAFLVRKEQRRDLESVLRKWYDTRHTPLRRGYSMTWPDGQKRRCVEELRSSLRAGMRMWFRQNLPGAFSAQEAFRLMPTYELIVTDKSHPFCKRAPGVANSALLRGLGLDRDFEAWHSVLSGKISVAWGRWGNGDTLRSHCTIGVLKEEAEKFCPRSSDADFPINIFWKLNQELDDFFVGASQRFLMEQYEVMLGTLRDAPLDQKHIGKPQRLLAAFREQTEASVDLAMVVPELVAQLKRGRAFEEFPAFIRGNAESDGPLLGKVLSDDLLKRAERLLPLNSTIRELLAQRATMVSAHENFRLQQRVTLLAIITLVVAVAAIPAGVWTTLTTSLENVWAFFHRRPM